MSAPGLWRWNQALEKVPYYIHIAPFISEMAEYADIFLPATTFMEEWAYDHSPPGSGFAEVRLKQPVVTPLDNTRTIGDIIFEIAGMLGGTFLLQQFLNQRLQSRYRILKAEFLLRRLLAFLGRHRRGNPLNLDALIIAVCFAILT